MKVGDYVRTKDYQNIRSRIGKIIKQDEKYYYLDIDENTQTVWEEDIVLKSSPNIIDLIEVGDILTIRDIFGNLSKVEVDENFKLLSGKIISIVTKEAFESMEYRIGE